jgi:hypothetical protein
LIIEIKNLHVGGITFYPFVFLKSGLTPERRKVLVNHEKIHLRQQLELLIIPFYFLYLFNYFINLIIYRKHQPAYRNICFEREAFTFESNQDFLSKRKAWSFVRYIQ